MSVISVKDLSVTFGRRNRVGVADVNLELAAGERLGIIGESGSGKSVTALAIMGLLPETAHVNGQISVAGNDIMNTSETELCRLRGNVMSMVFQEPMTALDPTMRVGRQVAEAFALHRSGDQRDPARAAVLSMLDRVGIRDPARVAQSYPHQLSGGQRQRVVVAMALINSPDVVICDEPTTALDVTVQDRVLRVLDETLTEVGAACLFISHDLAVVSQICSRVAVMYRGEIVEVGSIGYLLDAAEHPYTRKLMAAALATRWG